MPLGMGIRENDYGHLVFMSRIYLYIFRYIFVPKYNIFDVMFANKL